MRIQAVGAILEAVGQKRKAPAALRAQHIKGAIAEQAVEVLRVRAGMTGEILAFCVGKISVVPLFAVLHPPGVGAQQNPPEDAERQPDPMGRVGRGGRHQVLKVAERHSEPLCENLLLGAARSFVPVRHFALLPLASPPQYTFFQAKMQSKIST